MDQPHSGSFSPRKEGGSGTGRNVGELQTPAKGTRPDREGHTACDSFHTERPAEAESSQATARPGQGVAGRACCMGVGLLRRRRSETRTVGQHERAPRHQRFPFSWLAVRAESRPLGLYSLPGSSALGIFQPRIMEWVAISSRPRDPTCVSCAGRQIPYRCTTWEAFVCDRNSSLERASPRSE